MNSMSPIARFVAPVPIHFIEAIPIAVVGLLVNIASAWLLKDGDHHHGHSHGHGHAEHAGHDHNDEESKSVDTADGLFSLSIFVDGVPPVFRLQSMELPSVLPAERVTVTTIWPDGARETVPFVQKAGYLESPVLIREPHVFTALVTLPSGEH